ncbi:MAG: phosphatidylserine decarboxylase family protein [Rhodothermales bacterium]
MALAREGFLIIAAVLALAALCVAAGLWVGGIVGGVLIAIGGVSLGFTLWFFRDPKRFPPEGASTLILSPADGKVIEIVEEEEPLYLREKARRLSIFLSPLNVHVNRVPIDGVVEYENYYAGEYLVAWHPKASTLNERSEVGMRHPSGVPVLFKQIAGAVARRIVCYAKVGEEYEAGDRYGIVKFGSRMDVIAPLDVAFSAQIGDRVAGGETVIGTIPAHRLVPASPSTPDSQR